MDLKPVNERIIVVPKKSEEKSKGIYIPRTSELAQKQDEKPEVGFIIAMDDGIEEPKCKVGDKIIFNRYATTHITYEDKIYLVMLESSVLAIFNKVDENEIKEYTNGQI